MGGHKEFKEDFKEWLKVADAFNPYAPPLGLNGSILPTMLFERANFRCYMIEGGFVEEEKLRRQDKNTMNTLKQLILFLITLTVIYYTAFAVITAWKATAIDYQRIGQVVEQDRQRNGIAELEGKQ